MQVNVKTGKCIIEPIPYIKFKYELDDFQKHACNSINDGHHILVTAHTGSGKTTVAEYACAYSIANNKNAIYTAPIKALSLQTYSDLSKKHPDWEIGLQTGDVTIKPEAQIMIMTTEILRDLLYSEKETAILDTESRIAKTNCVIFDEVHYIKDKDRGTVWEESIIDMPRHIVMVMLSATIPESVKFAEWISNEKKQTVDVVNTSHRVVPLTHYVLDLDKKDLITVMSAESGGLNRNKLNLLNKYCFDESLLNSYINQMNTRNLLPALFFRFNRVQCEKLAKRIHVRLVTTDESKEINKIFKRCLGKLKKGKFDGMNQANVIHALLLKGICYHHSGLLHELKEIIQEIFAAGLIKVLFVTETFAAGVNVPAKSVVFLDLKKYDSHASGHRALMTEEYHQMAGRAGRRGLDVKGSVFLAPLRGMPYSTTLVNILDGKMRPFESQFKVSPVLILKMIRSNKSYDKSINGSMLALKNSVNTSILTKELDLLKLNIAETALLTKEIPETVRILVNEKASIKNNKQASKKIKKFNMKLSKLPDNVQSNFNKTIKLIELEKEQTEKLTYLENQVNNSTNKFKYETDNIIEYLIESKYIFRNDSEEASDLSEEHRFKLTMKGKIASEINECNMVLLTEIIQQSYLDEWEFSEIIALLSLFIEEKETERTKKISKPIERSITHIGKLAQELSYVEDKFGLSYLGTDWEIYKEFVDIGYMWASGASINQIYTITDIYEGNFVRNILKLRSMCKAIMKICDICQNHVLAKKLEDYESLLIRDIVVPDSLCLH
jgi:superfamily II RNA helicase